MMLPQEEFQNSTEILIAAFDVHEYEATSEHQWAEQLSLLLLGFVCKSLVVNLGH